MQDLIINIPFNYEIFIRNNKLKWRLAYRKTLRSNIFYTALSVCILIGGLFNDISDPIISIIAGGFLFYILLSWAGILERLSKFHKLIYQHANEYKEQQMDCTYTFTDEDIIYNDKEKTFRFNWSLCVSFNIYKDHILINLRDSMVMFIISREEVSGEQYQEIKHILTEKSHQTKLK